VQVAQGLADEIARGVYREGDRVPGERLLAEKWSVSDKTAREAIAILVSSNVLRKGVRTQPAVVAATREQARKARNELKDFEARSQAEAQTPRLRPDSSVGAAQIREELAAVRKYAETIEARVLAIELRERTRDQREDAAEGR